MKKFYLIFLFLFLSLEAFSQPIKITKVNDLDFDDVVQTESKDISLTNSKAAKFKIVSNNDRDIYIDLILPTHFANGAYLAEVVFDATRTGWSLTNNPATSTTFNPFQQLHLVAEKNDPIYIWVGSVLNTQSTTEPGNYTGTITIKVTIN